MRSSANVAGKIIAVMDEELELGGGSDLGDNMEEEEPLFADDLEDIPPLPPPLPPLSQHNYSQQSTAADPQRGDEGVAADGMAPPPPAQPSRDQDLPQKKRKPILTLTTDRIFSEKGLPHLETEFPKLKFKGKGHERSDLKYLLQQYEHWANRLYPKLTFKDVLLRIERLSSTKDFKNRLLEIRHRHVHGGGVTLPLSDDDSEEPPSAPSLPIIPPDSTSHPPSPDSTLADSTPAANYRTSETKCLSSDDDTTVTSEARDLSSDTDGVGTNSSSAEHYSDAHESPIIEHHFSDL